jgi:hypothetical protein
MHNASAALSCQAPAEPRDPSGVNRRRPIALLR